MHIYCQLWRRCYSAGTLSCSERWFFAFNMHLFNQRGRVMSTTWAETDWRFYDFSPSITKVLDPNIFNWYKQYAEEGNAAFKLSHFEEALKCYSEALNSLKSANAPQDAIILLNRAATYISLKRFVDLLIITIICDINLSSLRLNKIVNEFIWSWTPLFKFLFIMSNRSVISLFKYFL